MLTIVNKREMGMVTDRQADREEEMWLGAVITT